MAATSATTGKGLTVGYSDTDGGSLTYLAEVFDCPIPERSVPQVDATHYTSQNNTEETIPTGWIGLGELALKLNWTSEGEYAMNAILGVRKYFTITKADGATWDFYGNISKIGGTLALKDRVVQDITITRNGAVTFTRAAS